MKKIIEDSKLDLNNIKSHSEETVEVIKPTKHNGPLKVIFKYISHQKKELFTIYVDYWEKEKNLNLRYIMHTDDVHDVSTMLKLLGLYKSFSNKEIKFNGQKLFGDIIQGHEKSWEFENVDDMIRFWKKIYKLEQLIKAKFKFHIPLSKKEIEKLEILSRSLIDKKPCRIGSLDNIVFDISDREHLENLKGASGSLAFVLNTPDEEFLGVSLSRCYKAVFYGPIEITGYTILKESASGIKCQLQIAPQKGAVAAIMYFADKDEADEFMSSRMDEFKQAAWIGEDISNPV